MVPKRKTTPVLILALSILFAAGAALAASSAGQWSGTVASVAGDDLALVGVSERFRLAGRVTELISGRALSPTSLAAGSAVTLRIGTREADGRFRVDRVLVQPKNPLAIQGEISSVGSDGRHLSIFGVRVEVDEHTAYAGRGDAGRVLSGRDLRAGMTAQVSLTATAAGSLQASEVRVMSGRGRSARVMSGRPTEPGEDQEFKGTVVTVGASAWTIDDRTVAVNDQTVFIGAPGLGDFVEVRFHLDSNGNAVAERIQKEDGANDELEFRGIVEAIGDTSWTISGRVVEVTARTVIRGNPRVGDLVEVRTDRAADGTLTATDIHREDGVDDEREFRGIVESIGATSWTIGGRVVLVNASTVILRNPRVGDLAEVHADRAADGTLTATRIKREDGTGNADDEREFKGIVSSIGSSSWTIGDLVVLVNSATVIFGDPQVGDLVEVHADRASDGTLTATRIKKEDDDDDDNGGPGGGGDDDPPGDDNGGGSGGGGNDDPPGDDNGGGSGGGGGNDDPPGDDNGGGNSGPGGN